MTVETQFLLAMYSIVVTICFGFVAYSLFEAKRTIRLVGLAAKAKEAVRSFEASTQQLIAEAEEIVRKAKAKTEAEAKPRPAPRKAVTATRKAK